MKNFLLKEGIVTERAFRFLKIQMEILEKIEENLTDINTILEKYSDEIPGKAMAERYILSEGLILLDNMKNLVEISIYVKKHESIVTLKEGIEELERKIKQYSNKK